MPIHPDLRSPYPPDWRDRAHPFRVLGNDAHPRAARRGANAARAGCSRADATGRAAHLALEKKGQGVG